jgi:molybdopterin synthase catalytic subunit
MVKCAVQFNPIDEKSLHAEHPCLPNCGAEVWFYGRVRNHNLGREVRSVEYDAFGPLCENIFREIAEESKKGFQAGAVTIVHRHGLLNIGEISVAIGVSTPHRDEAYKISRHIIEQIKVRAPIWKKENYRDGESEWVRGHTLCQHPSC